MSSEPMPKTGDEPGTYVYEPAGIRERSGSIPTWLKLVSLGLIAWGIYYTIRFWSSY
ncbi:MAG: hypothetical protein OZ918_02545 [Nitrospirales bacterium]|nr:hypothetical protein [Nitrospirales bacterium]QOJ35422.1 MAG: hypothetical protein HRU82_10935 [Nitrospira sp.]